jgi:hypothetical protein
MRQAAFDSGLTFPVILALLLGAVVTVRAGFPEPEDLPSQKELPDPLRMLDGRRIATPEEWKARRRPELKALFQHYMYGYFPAEKVKITATVDKVDRRYFEGKATKKEVTIGLGPPRAPKIHLLLVIPNSRKKAAPVFLGLNFCGNHTVLKDPTIPLPTVWMPNTCPGCKDNKATDAGRGKQVNVWAMESMIERGYAVATFYCGDIAPDRPGLTDGIFPYYPKKGESRPGPRDWAAIAAWAWGLERAVDYLVTDPDIDARHIAVVGHSRLGKTALLAGAFDERIALVIPHQAGCGGTAPSRGKVGESVKQINDRFPHWFNAEFKKFNAQPDRLPFDQHCLVALCAPRPVLFTNATEDTWANPEGQFQVLRGADPVYRLLDAGGLEAKKMPRTGVLIDSKLGYHIRPGKHSMGKEDWKVWLEFVEKHWGKPDTPQNQ